MGNWGFGSPRDRETREVYSPLVALRSAPLLSVAEKQAQILDTDWVPSGIVKRGKLGNPLDSWGFQ